MGQRKEKHKAKVAIVRSIRQRFWAPLTVRMQDEGSDTVSPLIPTNHPAKQQPVT
jgi:hypothetical protein